MIKIIQDYIKDKGLAELSYVVCHDEVMFPYSKDLSDHLSGYSTTRLSNKLVIEGDHGLPTYYMTYQIKSDKRYKPVRVLNQTVVYKIGDTIISLVGGKVVMYPKGGLLTVLGEDSPETREVAYTLALTLSE
jgi:hypothetical protein